jgi:lactate dehydrogenase-like 2-hydroxyacid dehydrogenase
MLGNLGSGYNNVDVEEATKRGIPVFNTPTAVVNPTAEMTMSLLLGLCRGVVRYDRTLRTDGVCPKELLSYADMTLAGKTLGIVGYGRIGQKVAELAKAFGMRILICDSHHQESLPLEELLPQVDVLTLHLPYRVENHHLINAHTLSLMKSSAYLLNVARGPIVEEKALVEALKTGRLKGAALDVHEFEPLVSQAIRELPNVVITPHISTNLAEVRSAMLAELLEGMRFFQETHTLPANTVNKRELSY